MPPGLQDHETATIRPVSYLAQVKAEQEKIRGQYYHKQDRLLPYTEAQTLAPVFDRESYRLPASFGEHNLLGKNMDLQD